MEPTTSQAPETPQNDPNDAAASLAMATHISTQLAMPQQIEGSATDPTAQTTKTDVNIQQVEKTITDGMDELKKEIKGNDLRTKIDEIESELQTILGDDTNDGQTETS